MPPGFTISQTPPHLTLNAAPLTRNFGTDLPLSQRAVFAKKYPQGLPSVYKMVGPHDEGVPVSYLEEHLPIGFYTNPPSYAPAKFSTGHGERPFRTMAHILPRRRIHLWDKDELQAACNSTRKTYWADMKSMTRPSCWDDLWMYYDAFDLYHYGVMNLWNLVNQLVDENVLIYDGMERECANHIGQWADEWIGMEQNQRKLREWTEEKDSSIVFILSDQDRKSMGDIPDDMIPLVASALKARRHMLLTGVENFRKNREGASDVMEACKNRNFQNWLAGEQVFEKNALPSPPLTEDHRCSPASKNAPAPCFQQDGRHYYLPEAMGRSSYGSISQSSAVEELKKSSAAAVTTTKRPLGDVGVDNSHIIARGTNRLPPDDVREAQARAQDQHPQGQTASKESAKSTGNDGNAPAIGESQQSAVQKKTEGEEEEAQRSSNQPEKPQTSVESEHNVVPIVVTHSHTSPSPMPRKSRIVSKRGSNEKMASSPTPPSGQCEPHHAQHVKRASLSGQTSSSTEIPNHSPISIYNRPATASGQPASNLGDAKPAPYVQDKTESYGDQASTLGHKGQKLVHEPATALSSVPVQAPPNPKPLASHPLNVVRRAVSSNEINHLPARPAFLGDQGGFYGHSTHNGVEGRNTSDEVKGQPEVSRAAQSQGRVSEPSPCSNEIHQPHLLPQRPPAVIPSCELTSSSDSQAEKSLSGADPNFTNTKNTMVPSPGAGRTGTAPRGGYKNNNNNYRGRRDFQSQKSFNSGYHYSSSQQNKQFFHGGPEAADPGHGHDHGPERQWRRDGTPAHYNHGRHHPNNVHCNNNGTAPYEYNDCSCGECSERNRSVWVRVKDNMESHTKDIQTRLKFGLSAIYGDVDDVFPVYHRMGNAFIVRFNNEDSVVQAIRCGNIKISDKRLPILLGPAHRSKWITKTYPGFEQSKRQNFEQRQQHSQPQPQHHNHIHHHHQQNHHQQQQPPQQQQYPCMTQPYVNQGMYHGGGTYNPMPFGSREPQQMRMFGPYSATAAPHGTFQNPQRGAAVPPFQRSGDAGYGPNYGSYSIGGQQQSLPVWQHVQDQHGFHHGSGQAAVGQSEQRAAFKAPSADVAECKSQANPSSEETLEKKESMVRLNQQQQQKKKQTPVTPQREASSRSSNHQVKVSLPTATPTNLVDVKSGDGDNAASAKVTMSPKSKEDQSGTVHREQHEYACANDVDSLATKVTDEAVADGELAATTAQNSETSALVDNNIIMDRPFHAATSTLTELDGKGREQARDGVALPMPANKVPKTPVKSKPSSVVDESAESVARGPPLDSHQDECTLTQPAQPDTDTMSAGSSSSKTMSMSSTPRTSSPRLNCAKTPFNSETKHSSDGAEHRQKSSQSSPSPTKSGSKNARKQNANSRQQDNNKVGEGSHVLNAAVKGFDFPSRGRGTVRFPKQSGKPSILDDGKSSRGRGKNTMKRLGKQNQQSVPVSVADGHDVQQTRAGTGEDETKHHDQASPSGKEPYRVVSRPQQSQQSGHASGEDSAVSVPSDKMPDKVAVASTLKVPKRRKNNGKTNTPLAQEGRSEKGDRSDKNGQTSPNSTGEGHSPSASVSSSVPKDKPSPEKKSRPTEQADRIGRNTASSSPDSAGAEQASQAGVTNRSPEDDKSTLAVAEGVKDMSSKTSAQKEAVSRAETKEAGTKPGPSQGATLSKSTSGSILDEKTWPSLPSSGGGLSPQKKSK
ncbi:hypothetical protein E4U55_000720 [Claviceps digitariae]|nr:hypothetical protein E4U55_000720 [Claviceps digitariae]